MPSTRRATRLESYQREKQGGESRGVAAQVAEEHGVALEELLEFAVFMEVDTAKETYLLTVVAEAISAPLPPDWIELEDAGSGQAYYCNQKTQQTTWEHPLDQYFKNLLFIERKNYKARKKESGRNGGQMTRPDARVGPGPASAVGSGGVGVGGSGGGGWGSTVRPLLSASTLPRKQCGAVRLTICRTAGLSGTDESGWPVQGGRTTVL
jgi:hypothetical protein